MIKPLDVVYDICRHYIHDQAEVVDATLVQRVSGYHRARNLAELTTCSRHHDCALHSVDDWRFLRQIEAFFKKNTLLSDTSTCQRAAKESFMTSEVICSETNRRLQHFAENMDVMVKQHPELTAQMHRASRYIVCVLGEFQPFLAALPQLVRVTPGATSTAARRDSLPPLKMRMKLFATRRAHPYLKAIYRYYGFNEPRCRPVVSSRVELVPKNWKTYRTIACEPEGNLPLQLAFDTYAKRRLRRFGIDLSDQSANQKKAMHASLHNDYVTVDFSAASDTVAYNAVSLMFPADWFKFLSDVRTPCYRGLHDEDSAKIFAKFSSMGNGSTFTIESLLFAAACHAVGSSSFLVYGDDVIIERSKYEAFLSLTKFLGFTINREKSFADGPFRESCGMDAYDGIDVTPIYIRNIDSRKASLCHLVNTIGSLTVAGGRLEAYLADIIRSEQLPFVPFNSGTMSGVWIEPSLARAKKLLTSHYYIHGNAFKKHTQSTFIDSYKAYTPKSVSRAFVDSRGYYLWFLNKHDQVMFAGPWELSRNVRSSETSSVPVFTHKYVRKRVVWQKPREATPPHLDRWGELLLR